jgi:hypothetical protein
LSSQRTNTHHHEPRSRGTLQGNLFRVHTPPHDVNPRGPNSTAPVSQLTARGSSAPTRYGCPPRPGCRSALLRLRTNLGSCQSPSLAIARPSAGKFRLRDGTTAGSSGLAPQTPKRGPLDPGFRMVGNAASPSAPRHLEPTLAPPCSAGSSRCPPKVFRGG